MGNHIFHTEFIPEKSWESFNNTVALTIFEMELPADLRIEEILVKQSSVWISMEPLMSSPVLASKGPVPETKISPHDLTAWLYKGEGFGASEEKMISGTMTELSRSEMVESSLFI